MSFPRSLMQRRRAAPDPDAPGAAPAHGARDDFNLVRRTTHLVDRRKVELYLPDILGRALARAWIDNGFRGELAQDPKGLLARYHVHLPDTISIEMEVSASQRERLVVYETRPGEARQRLLYLQLVMTAGR